MIRKCRLGRVVSLLAMLALCAAAVVAEDQANPVRSFIHAGPNVQVSTANPKQQHYEIMLAADPNDANHLLAGSMTHDPEGPTTLAYVSTDGGKSWKQALGPQLPGMNSNDPAVMYGLDGSAYFLSWGWDNDGHYKMLLRRSPDGGSTWLEPSELETLDREYLAIDRSQGKYRGRIYVYGQRGQLTIDGKRSGSQLIVLHSTDNGATFPLFSSLASDHPSATLAPANSVVLSDGTLVLAFHSLIHEGEAKFDATTRKPNAQMKAVTSHDGGQFFSPAAHIADLAVDWGNYVTVVPTLAADGSDGPFKDRLYAAWTDIRSGKGRVLLSYSADKGKSWSPATEIDDDPGDSGFGKGPDCFMPIVAVNKQGVVGVMWYDRRDNRDQDRGWWTRFAVSFDGGETFQPSVRVSVAPNVVDPRKELMTSVIGNQFRSRSQAAASGPLHGQIIVHGFNFNGGHTAGLAADANGVFHPLWVDNRTGVSQIWTAAVTVDGRGQRNGGHELADLEDVDSEVTLDYGPVRYDPASGIACVDATLRNTSQETIEGPLWLRLLSVSSELGVPAVSNSDNHQTSSGAAWNFTALAPGGKLKPGEQTGAKRLEFRLTGLRPVPLTPQMIPGGFVAVNLSAKALGRVVAKATSGAGR